VELSRWVRTAEAFRLNPQPLTVRAAQQWGVVTPSGEALSRARELAKLYLKAPEVACRNTACISFNP
jgi:hypothetical protein